jgi:outer membrane lipoprotein-sorting protein
MKRTFTFMTAFVAIFALTNSQRESYAEEGQLDAVQIIEKSQLAFYSAADDMKARVTMNLVDSGGNTRTRVMSMLRRDTDDKGNQKYFIYFHEPGDVRQMTFMVWKDVEKEDDRWIFVPAVDLIRRIAADDKRSSFVGSDFTYEDISGRDIASDTHTLAGEESIGDRTCHVIESVPVDETDYSKKVSWIDKETFLPLRESYYDRQGEMFRQFTADEVKNIVVGTGEQIASFPTVVKRTMTNLKKNHRTEVSFDSITYNIGLDDKDFSERQMRRPPRNWIQ